MPHNSGAEWEIGFAIMRSAAFVLTLLVVTGCGAPVSTVSRPDTHHSAAHARADTPEASLFSGDSEILSDEAISRILEYDYSPPPLNRIALMPFGREIWSEWSEELAIATERMKKDVLDRLSASRHAFDASYLPSILIPQNKTVPYLREAAARYQADLLVVYRSYCNSFERYRFLSPNRTRAFCGVEAVLLDTRTGLVPFTSVAQRTFEAEQNNVDVSFRATVLKAQLEAITNALADVSSEIVEFLARQ